MRLYKFKDVVGNTTSVRLIQKSLQRNSFPKFTIMSGVPGTGKSTCAEIAGLSLTCQSPIDGSPCLECKQCKNNLKALASTGVSTNLIKKNLGLLNSKKDVLEMIKEIFILQSAMGNNVYILEEAHSLSSQDQTALLEEIDRLDVNTYIIICTSKPYKLLPELRSRAIMYNFNRLNLTDVSLLIHKVCVNMGIQEPPREVTNMLTHYGKGVPRDIVKMIDFIDKNSPTEEEIADMLGIISYKDFADLILSMTIGLKDMNILLDSFMGKYTYDIILEQFKGFIIDITFFIAGNVNIELSEEDKKLIKSCFNSSKLFKINRLLETMRTNEITENDFKLFLLRVRQIIVDKTALDVFKDNTTQASKQSVQARANYSEMVEVNQELEESSARQLSNKDFIDYFNEKN